MKKYLILLIVTAALLHGSSSRAATHSCRQGIDSLVNSRKTITTYPNPVTVAVMVKSVQPIRELIIYAMDGRQVRRIHPPGKNNLVEVADLVQGPYVLNAIFVDGTRTSKMIIKQ